MNPGRIWCPWKTPLSGALKAPSLPILSPHGCPSSLVAPGKGLYSEQAAAWAPDSVSALPFRTPQALTALSPPLPTALQRRGRAGPPSLPTFSLTENVFSVPFPLQLSRL